MITLIVNPEKITKRLKSGNPFIDKELNIPIQTEIRDGEWDTDLSDLESSLIYQSLIDMFTNGIDWKETSLYKYLIDQILINDPKWGCSTEELVMNRGRYLINLYEYIKSTGDIPKGCYLNINTGLPILDQNGNQMEIKDDDICACIDRDGKIIFANNGTHRFIIAKILKLKSIPIKVWKIHKSWDDYKKEIKKFCDDVWGGKAYQNLPHPDLQDFELMWPDRRYSIIKNNTNLTNESTLVDVGSLFGNICYQAELDGFDCTAVEIDKKYLNVMRKLHSSYSMKYKIIEKSFLDIDFDYDIIVALNIFHHFIKTEELYTKFINFLQKIKFKEMYIQTHNTEETQMKTAYKNMSPYEFVELISKETGKNNIIFLDEINERKIYKIF